jgi:2-keto-4-pentenoate hydratase/2-oxohepta-3-ene-1,7-dioic acid hydratase in catechol pathway
VRLGNLDGRGVVLAGGGVVDVEDASGGLFPADPHALLQRWPELVEWWAVRADRASTSAGVPRTVEERSPLLAPSPTPRQVFAVALNYAPHAAEGGYEPPADPLVFTKFPSCITGPVTTVRLPPGRVDWEVELVVVIGVEAFDVAPERGWEPVAGVTVGQDITDRHTQLQGHPPQFSLGKSFPGFGPTGPFICTPDEVADPDDLGIECWLNGEQVQAARTKDMIFPVPELVSRISRVCRLYPGDLIFTGTPSGIGHRRSPPSYLTAGDVLISRIEGLGHLRTTFGSTP